MLANVDVIPIILANVGLILAFTGLICAVFGRVHKAGIRKRDRLIEDGLEREKALKERLLVLERHKRHARFISVRLEKVTADWKDAEKRIYDLRQINGTLSSQLGAALAKHERELVRLVADNDAMRGQLNIKVQEAEALQSELTMVGEESSKLLHQYSDLYRRLGATEVQRDQARQSRDKLESSNRELSVRVGELDRAISKCEESRLSAVKERDKLLVECARLDSERAQASEALSQAQDMNGKYAERVMESDRQWREAYNSASDKVGRLQQLASRVETELGSIYSTMRELGK